MNTVGTGGFGKVWRVISTKDKTKVFALKEMAKSRIIVKKSISSVLMERNLLSELYHP
jgi:serine/threonine kinase 32